TSGRWGMLFGEHFHPHPPRNGSVCCLELDCSGTRGEGHCALAIPAGDAQSRSARFWALRARRVSDPPSGSGLQGLPAD
ncbi:hypothetical protein J7K19_06665, partial [bacterium]|nr:hypothetical protein [bacterium]